MRGSASAFDAGFEMATELGIPDDIAAEIAGELCCSPYGEGPCAEESELRIRSEAKKFVTTTHPFPGQPDFALTKEK